MILVICSYFLIVFVLKYLLFCSSLGCGNDVMFPGSNLDCVHLTQPAKLISNYGSSLQILCPSTQTQTWTNRLRACGGICALIQWPNLLFLKKDINPEHKKKIKPQWAVVLV